MPYTWDNNGNLLSDGVYTYTFNHANQLVGVSGAGMTLSYAYNGQGDRVSRMAGITTTTYTLDLAAGLTQVLSDGTDTYLYGVGRIAQSGASGAQYFLGDALGSMRLLVDANGEVLLAQSYEPYGEVLASVGDGTSSYGFAAEMRDLTGLIYLRARYYASSLGRFISKDTWPGDYNRPLSLNGWNYVEADPINATDPSGKCLDADMDGKCDPGWRCSTITDPVAREFCWQSSCSASVVEPPGLNCNPDCVDAYKTYKEVVTALGYEPDIADILYMVAAKEYFNVVDRPYHNNSGYIENPIDQNYPEPNARFTGREALARAYYEFCGPGELNCRGTQLYRFLSGYEPWSGHAAGQSHLA